MKYFVSYTFEDCFRNMFHTGELETEKDIKELEIKLTKGISPDCSIMFIKELKK